MEPLPICDTRHSQQMLASVGDRPDKSDTGMPFGPNERISCGCAPLDVQPDVQHANRVGECADGEIVHARSRVLGRGLE